MYENGNFLPEFEHFYVFLKNRDIISKIRRSKVTDYAALKDKNCLARMEAILCNASSHRINLS